MVEPETGADRHPHRRHRRTARKRARNQRILAAVVGLVVTAALVLFATDVIRVGGSDTPSLANTAPATSAAAAAAEPATSSTVKGQPCRAVTADDPLRLWIAGDSLAGSLGPSLGAITGATGVVQPYFDSRVSSGLTTPSFFDWPQHAASEIERLSPDVVVFIIGANDWSAFQGDNSKADYAKLVEEMVTTLSGSGRTVYWVSPPILKDDKMNAGVMEANAVTAEVLKRHPNVQYVDAYKLFSDADGQFSTNLPDETGKVVTMRTGDGVHLTVDGGQYLARTVYKLLDAQCHVNAQKVEGADKETIETEGSTQVAPGSSNNSNSNSSSSGYTVETTPPATYAPTTTKPYVPPVTTTPPPVTTTPPPTTPTAPTLPPLHNG